MLVASCIPRCLHNRDHRKCARDEPCRSLTLVEPSRFVWKFFFTSAPLMRNLQGDSSFIHSFMIVNKYREGQTSLSSQHLNSILYHSPVICAVFRDIIRLRSIMSPSKVRHTCIFIFGKLHRQCDAMDKIRRNLSRDTVFIRDRTRTSYWCCSTTSISWKF